MALSLVNLALMRVNIKEQNWMELPLSLQKIIFIDLSSSGCLQNGGTSFDKLYE
jgi:hypothetical protein